MTDGAGDGGREDGAGERDDRAGDGSRGALVPDGGDEREGVGDGREKHVTVVTRDGERRERGDVYLRHATDAWLVSPEPDFPPAATDRYPKADLRKVEVTQHHAACFITTATVGTGTTLDALRGFRDDALRSNPAGRGLVGLYYAVSPPVAETLARHPESRTAGAVRRLVRRCGALADARADADAAPRRLALTAALTLLYAVGLLVALAGHVGISYLELAGGGR